MTAEPTLAQRYDPAPADDYRWESAIGRRNTTWAHWREAADLLQAVEALGADTRAVVRNYNDALDDYERAHDAIIREKVLWKAARRPW